MDLTEQQVRYIQEGAERTGVVETVRLYGSRAKGSARPDSDVDLALTVGTGNYVRFANEWQKDLSDVLVLKVKLKQYNSPADDTVRRYCDEFSVVLFPK
jgi:predicted nucleotidyltransferase